jgi:sterol desaturase/sphingolipid hydroxylase (fatty acid hydroxylase superfamily)
MHHIAPQAAISATYVHPGEYAMWCLAMQLPFAVAGVPLYLYLIPCGWGMLTGSGAHSGYGDTFANGAKHNAHHVFSDVNFGLLMLADMAFGTHWSPGDPPRPSYLTAEIESEFPDLYQTEGIGGMAKGTPEAAQVQAEMDKKKKKMSGVKSE